MEAKTVKEAVESVEKVKRTLDKIHLLMDRCGYAAGETNGRDAYIWKKDPDNTEWIRRVRYEEPDTLELCDQFRRVRGRVYINWEGASE